MKIFCQNTANGFVPVYDSDWEAKNKLKPEEVYYFEVKLGRNYKFLKKFMALCKIGAENSKNVTMPLKAYRKYATIKAGFSNIYHTPKGIFVEAQSIAFENMDEEQFQEVYSRVLDFVIEDIQANKEMVENELAGFL